MVGLTRDLSAQVRASERGTTTQTVDGTTITVDYSRPRVRGRTGLFGTVERWGATWTPGANMATTVAVSKDVTLDGHPVRKGKYSVWLVLREHEPWTLVLDPNPDLFHTMPPDSAASQVRVPVTPQPGSFTEVLTWSFPEVRSDGVTLAMAWGTMMVTVKVKVPSSYTLAFPADSAAPYLGSYRMSFVEAPPGAPAGQPVTLAHEQGMLVASMPEDPYFNRMVLIRIGDGWFIPGLLEKGELYETVPEWVFEFAFKDGKVTGFEVREMSDKVIARAPRVP
jgi:hypothetical protein